MLWCEDADHIWAVAGLVTSGILHLVWGAIYNRGCCSAGFRSVLNNPFLNTLRIQLCTIGVFQLLGVVVRGDWGTMFLFISAMVVGFFFLMNLVLFMPPFFQSRRVHTIWLGALAFVATMLGLWMAFIMPTSESEVKPQPVVPLYYDIMIWEPTIFLIIFIFAALTISFFPPPTIQIDLSSNPHPHPPDLQPSISPPISTGGSTCMALRVTETLRQSGNNGVQYESVQESSSAIHSVIVKEVFLRSCMVTFLAEFSLALIRFCLFYPAQLWYRILRTYALVGFLIVLRFHAFSNAHSTYRIANLTISIRTLDIHLIPLLLSQPPPLEQQNIQVPVPVPVPEQPHLNSVAQI